jgi:hypothetical protein
LTVRLDAEISTRNGNDTVGVRAGRLIFMGDRKNDYRGAFGLILRHETSLSKTLNGTSRYIAATPDLPAETSAGLKEALQHAILHLGPADHNAMKADVTRWMSAGPADRPGIEREMELRLLRLSADQTAREDATRERIRSLLTPGQYQAVLSMGQRGPTTAPAATTKPSAAGIEAPRRATLHGLPSLRPTTAPTPAP